MKLIDLEKILSMHSKLLGTGLFTASYAGISECETIQNLVSQGGVLLPSLLVGGMGLMYGQNLRSKFYDGETGFYNSNFFYDEYLHSLDKDSEYSIGVISFEGNLNLDHGEYSIDQLKKISNELKQSFSSDDFLIGANPHRGLFFLGTNRVDEDWLNLEFQELRLNLIEKYGIHIVHGIYTKKSYDETCFDVFNSAKDMHYLHSLLHLDMDNIHKIVSDLLKIKDSYTHSHSNNTRKYSLILGMEANLSYNEILMLETAAAHHDIGKIGIPDGILNSGGALSDMEFKKIMTHPLMGYHVLTEDRHSTLLESMRPVLEHHEKWDGSGYPYGKTGKELHKLSNLIAVADVFSALTEDRPYRKKGAFSFTEAKKIIFEGVGTHFNPVYVDHFKSVEGKLEDFLMNPSLDVSHADF